MGGTLGDINVDEDMGIWNDDTSSYIDVDYGDGRDDKNVRSFGPFNGEVIGDVSAAMMVDDVDWNDYDGTDFDGDGEDDTEWGDDDFVDDEDR